MKTLVLCVKYKLPGHKNSFLYCILLVNVCTYVYYNYARTWYVYMYFFVFPVIFGIYND